MYLVIYSHGCRKHIGHCRVLKGGRLPYQMKLETKSIKDGDFVDFSYQICIYQNNQIQIWLEKGDETNW